MLWSKADGVRSPLVFQRAVFEPFGNDWHDLILGWVSRKLHAETCGRSLLPACASPEWFHSSWLLVTARLWKLESLFKLWLR